MCDTGRLTEVFGEKVNSQLVEKPVLKQAAKVRGLIILWVIIIVVNIYLSVVSDRTLSLRLAVPLLITLTAIINIRRSIKVGADYFLSDNAIVVYPIFQQQIKYDLNVLEHWNEHQYKFLGILLRREVTLTFKGESKLSLPKQDTSDYLAIINYLNVNASEKKEIGQ